MAKLVRASWDEATKLAADKFQEAKKDLVVLASGRLSNEDLFNLKQLADRCWRHGLSLLPTWAAAN